MIWRKVVLLWKIRILKEGIGEGKRVEEFWFGYVFGMLGESRGFLVGSKKWEIGVGRKVSIRK